MAHPGEGELGRRAMARLAALRGITDVPGRIERLFLSPAHRIAADATAEMMREAGCDSVSIDALGTVVGRYEGTEPGRPALLLGSHIDTVRDAGAFDGTLGVVAAIGVVEALARAGERLPFAVEALAFGDEENVRFPSLLSSSRALAGTLEAGCTDLRDADGVRLGDALLAFGGNPAGLATLARGREDTLGYLEVHIEQGPVLEAEDLPVGVVTAINGASRRKVTVTGEAGHAGTVPMGLRRDALAAAAEMVLAVQRIGADAPERVATIGILTVEPGAANVIPGRVSFTLDARSPSDADREAMVSAIEQAFREIAGRSGTGIAIETISDTKACPCDEGLSGLLADAVSRRQIGVRRLPSGAGHDAMAVAALCPVAMLFVRCKGGISHNPAEDITEGDADIAVRVLLDAVRSYRPPA
jgi:allantoate deiminase